jgi:hypothetical protein
MRNGLYRPPVNLPGQAPEPLPTLQMCTAAINQNNAEASNPAADMLPMTQIFGAISGTRRSFDPSNQDRRHQEPLVLPSIPCTTTPEPRFLLGSSQPHLQSLQLTVSAEVIVLSSSYHKLDIDPLCLHTELKIISTVYSFSLVFPLSTTDDPSRRGNVKASPEFNPRDHLHSRLKIITHFK